MNEALMGRYITDTAEKANYGMITSPQISHDKRPA